MDIATQWQGPWIVLGDFNAVLDSKDKRGGRSIAQNSSSPFRTFLQHGGMIDLGFKGPTYTWKNRRAGHTNIQERID